MSVAEIRQGSMEMLIASREATGTSRAPSLYFAVTRSRFSLLSIDACPALIAASIPWSTTAVAVFAVFWLIVFVPSISPREFQASLQRPSSWLPLAFFALAVVGITWADGPWAQRFAGLSPVLKLLFLPLLLYHFERSKRSSWVFAAFLISCSLLLALSWMTAFAPELTMLPRTAIAGVPVKNTIDQGQEFTLCIFGLAAVGVALLEKRRFVLAAATAVLGVAFFVNLTFVALARTSLMTVAILLAIFAFRYLTRQAALALIAAAALTAGMVWMASPYLQQRVESVRTEYHLYKEQHLVTSTGARLEWWARSMDF